MSNGTALRSFGADPLTGRLLYSLPIGKPDELPAELGLPSPHFVCLIAWDSTDATVDEVSDLASSLLANGASYVCAWGPGCERVHDIFDEVDVERTLEAGSSSDDCVMTTWHAKEQLSEALWFFLTCTTPAETYESTTRAALAITIGSPEWARETELALSDPGSFRNEVVGSD